MLWLVVTIPTQVSSIPSATTRLHKTMRQMQFDQCECVCVSVFLSKLTADCENTLPARTSIHSKSKVSNISVNGAETVLWVKLSKTLGLTVQSPGNGLSMTKPRLCGKSTQVVKEVLKSNSPSDLQSFCFYHCFVFNIEMTLTSEGNCFGVTIHLNRDETWQDMVEWSLSSLAAGCLFLSHWPDLKSPHNSFEFLQDPNIPATFLQHPSNGPGWK